MGLGKTRMMCCFISGLFKADLIEKGLVIVPPILMKDWITELSLWDLSQKTKQYYRNKKEAAHKFIKKEKGLIVSSYDSADSRLKNIEWDYSVFDEGHLLKNPHTRRNKSLKRIPTCCCIILTGTPMPNDPMELHTLVDFCHPGLLGEPTEFKRKYSMDCATGPQREELMNLYKPYLLRRLKDEVLADILPGKVELVVWLKLNKIQRSLYINFLRAKANFHSVGKGASICACTVLKKICDEPCMLLRNVKIGRGMTANDKAVASLEKFIPESANHSCKTLFLMSLLSKLIPEGHHVLIFSQTCEMLDCVEDCLRSKYKWLRLDGKTKNRELLIETFQKKQCPIQIFLLTTGAGALGLTLVKADTVILLDPSWNPSTDSQSVGRAYRIGQTKKVTVYRLITCGTIEEQIYKMQVYKTAASKTMTELCEPMHYFEKEDFKVAFEVQEEDFLAKETHQRLLGISNSVSVRWLWGYSS